MQRWGDALIVSLTGAGAMFFAAIPKIIAFAVILIVGWFVSKWIARGIAAALRSMKFNDLSERTGFTSFIRNTRVGTDPSGALALTAKWFVRLITVIVAFDTLGLPAVSQVLQRFLLWLPNLIVALVILAVAGLAANGLSRVVRGATGSVGFANPDLLRKITTAAIWTFGIVAAVNQIGVASTLVNALFMSLVGALALALGLAFGLGGKDTAAQVVRNWYERSRETAPRFQTARDIAAQEAIEEVQRRRPAA
jgi:hypothetical protein